MKREFFYVWNVTDKILAAPEKMTKLAADQFMKEFPKRFYAQGYYKTGSCEMIDPDNVILAAIPADEYENGAWADYVD